MQLVAGNNSYTVIGQLVSIENTSGGSVAQAKTSYLGSTVHTYRATIPDPGEVSGTLNYDPTDSTHKFIRDLFNVPANGPATFKALYNTGNTVSSSVFTANVSEFSGPTAGDVEENLTADFTLKKTGLCVELP